MKREIVEGIEGKTLQSVQVFLEHTDGSDGFEVRFTDRTGLFVALKPASIEVETVELRDWKEGEGKLIRKF